MYDDQVTVDIHALDITGTTDLEQIPEGHLLRLEEGTLGIKAGYLRTHAEPFYAGIYPGTLRVLELVSVEDAEGLIADGTPVHDARRARTWTGAFPAHVPGLRVGALRAALAATDLPDDAVVAIGAPLFPGPKVGSPADTRIEIGYYRPDPATAISGEAHGGEPGYQVDGQTPLHLPALVLNPTH